MINLDHSIKEIINKEPLSAKDAEFLISAEVDTWELLHGANKIRSHFKGNKIGLCSIINAKSGNCSEDCKFCAQSASHSAEIKTYPLVSPSEIKKGYQHSCEIGAQGFSIVTSGNELSDKEIDTISQSVREISARTSSEPAPSYLCGSLGRLTPAQLRNLKASGLTKCHHNLETSRKYFPKVCSSHTYDERLETIKNIKEAGLKVCCGGIFGMGETWQDRIDLAFTLNELKVDSIPLNFLIPIKGTALENIQPLSPMEILKIIALFRCINPEADIRICAGREKNLRDMQSWIFYAGANGLMIGGYLTQAGRSVAEDLQMIKDLGFVTT